MHGLEPSSTLFRHLFDPHLISMQHWINSSTWVVFVSYLQCAKLDSHRRETSEEHTSRTEFFACRIFRNRGESRFDTVIFGPTLPRQRLRIYSSILRLPLAEKFNDETGVSNILNCAGLVYLADGSHSQKQQAKGKLFHISRCILHGENE